MNCFSGSLILGLMAACAACGAPASEAGNDATSADYAVHYTVTAHPADSVVDVTMQVRQTRGQLRAVEFSFDAKRLSDIVANGTLIVGESKVTWQPDRRGGQIGWRVRPSHRRGGNGYDALLRADWGIFRAEDIVPRARTRTLKGATARTTLRFELPAGWSAITEYSSINDPIKVTGSTRRFNQPSGWIAIGDLGVRRETIAGIRVAIAAPQGETVRRMDMLALLNWTLPELTAITPAVDSRLTIVSAGDPMWRGGLSAPRSLFIHADRPLISENATSTLVHEVVHVVFGIRAVNGFDWIAEGLAEFYSLELLHRGGAITTRRYNRALEDQAEWAQSAPGLCGESSSGATTAAAVMTFRKLDEEIRKSTNGKHSLDNVVEALAHGEDKVTLLALQRVVEDLLKKPSRTLRADALPGCKQFAANTQA